VLTTTKTGITEQVSHKEERFLHLGHYCKQATTTIENEYSYHEVVRTPPSSDQNRKEVHE